MIGSAGAVVVAVLDDELLAESFVSRAPSSTTWPFANRSYGSGHATVARIPRFRPLRLSRFGSRRLGAALHQLGHHAQQVAIEDGVNQIALRGHERRVRPMLFVCTAQCSQSAGVRTWRCTLRDIRNTLSVRASRLTHRRTSTGVAGARQGRRRALLLVGPAVSPTSEPAGAP